MLSWIFEWKISLKLIIYYSSLVTIIWGWLFLRTEGPLKLQWPIVTESDTYVLSLGQGEWDAWPPRSPDLISLNVIHRAVLKHKITVKVLKVYLKQRNWAADESVNPELLSKVWNQVKFHLAIYRTIGGAHDELR